MKVERIKFKNHEIFGDLKIDFKDNEGNILNTIVIIGENGSGKTTLLKNIYDSFFIDWARYKESEENKVELTQSLYTTTIKLENNEIGILNPNIIEDLVGESNNPKIVYMPTEINFERVNKVDNTFNFTPGFQNIIDQNMTKNIPSLIATKINKEIFRNRNKTIGEVIDT